MSLLEILREKTQDLKKQYLTYTEKYARDLFATYQNMITWTEDKWLDHYNVTYEKIQRPDNTFYCKPFMVKYTYQKQYYKMSRDRSDIRVIVREGLDKLLKKELKKAEQHYEDSLIKLHSRIIAKGLIEDKIKVEYSRMDVNIEITITDGNQTIRAFTIIAMGPIVRPHYRYLIK